MAAQQLSSPLLRRLLPLSTSPFRPALAIPFLGRFQYPALPAVSISITIPSLLGDIWESVLRAVPKKKTSHMKKRHRQMAGKALKDVTALSKCSGCGRTKRAHILCPYCVESIKYWVKRGFRKSSNTGAKLM